MCPCVYCGGEVAVGGGANGKRWVLCTHLDTWLPVLSSPLCFCWIRDWS